MRTVLLRLEGPLQAWGTQGRFGIRDTDTEPSKSGVLGLVAAALGISRDDEARLAELARLEMAVRVDREGRILRDYHTAGGGRFRGGAYGIWVSGDGGRAKLGDTAPTERYYLADASFLVGLGGELSTVEQIARALESPVWTPYLGRRSCVPSVPLFAGVRDASPRAALEAEPLPRRLCPGGAPARLRLVIESADGQPRGDVPLSFALYHREHGRRFVAIDWLDNPKLEEGGDASVAPASESAQP